MVFPLIKIIQVSRRGILFFVVVVVSLSVYFTFNELPARLSAVLARGVDLPSIFLDHSINLRAGHIYFTFYEHLPESLVLQHPHSA